MEKLFRQQGLRHELIAAYSYFQLRYKDDKVQLFSAVEYCETVTKSNNLQLGRFKVDNGKQNQGNGAVSKQVPREKVLTFLGETRLGVNNFHK